MTTLEVPSPLVGQTWLMTALAGRSERETANDAARSLIIADVRWGLADGPKRRAYEAKRLPSAVFVDLDVDISAPAGPDGRHPLPSAEHFAAAMGRLGITHDSTVIAYDDAGGAMAASRLWFMLDALGVQAAVLDGGIDAWTGPVEVGEPEGVDAVHFAPVPWPADRFVTAEQVAEYSCNLIDARSASRFLGEPSPADPRPGHIPGASNLPWQDTLGDDHHLADLDTLTQLTRAFTPKPKQDTVVYCGSGVTACQTLLALRLGGIDGALYPGSWSQWAADPTRPVELGDSSAAG